MRFLFLLLVLSGCGDSPLFNHVDPSDIGRSVGRVEGLVFSRSGNTFDVNWQNDCPSFDACSFTVELAQPLAVDEEIFSELWMPSMGHGSSPITARMLGPTTWEFTDIYFIMPGEWEVVLKIKSGGVASDEVRLDYRL